MYMYPGGIIGSIMGQKIYKNVTKPVLSSLKGQLIRCRDINYTYDNFQNLIYSLNAKLG